ADGGAERRLVPDVVAGVDVGAVLDQQLDDRQLGLAGGDPQGGDAVLVAGVDVGAGGEGLPHGRDVAAADRRPEGVPLRVGGVPRGGNDQEEQGGSRAAAASHNS